jgi:hypothetical protein
MKPLLVRLFPDDGLLVEIAIPLHGGHTVCRWPVILWSGYLPVWAGWNPVGASDRASGLARVNSFSGIGHEYN